MKFATGLAYRPDQWLLSVADGHSKWAYSYQINADGTLTNKERFFWLHVPDWEDDAGAESVCYAKEGPMFVATRWGIQVCADDGPTQVILPMPDRSRVIGVCLGGRDLDTLFAFCGDKIWKRKVKVHAMGAFTPWTRSARDGSLRSGDRLRADVVDGELGVSDGLDGVEPDRRYKLTSPGRMRAELQTVLVELAVRPDRKRGHLVFRKVRCRLRGPVELAHLPGRDAHPDEHGGTSIASDAQDAADQVGVRSGDPAHERAVLGSDLADIMARLSSLPGSR